MIFNLSPRAKWQLTGSDRERYLNGQITQEVRHLSPTERRYACVTNVKGRLTADLYFHSHHSALILDAEPDQRQPLTDRLERYIIADDVTLEDITDHWHLFHAIGTSADTLQHSSLPPETICLHTQRLDQPGIDLWLPAGTALPDSLHHTADDTAWESHRILAGIPRMPAELSEDIFPPEAGLEKSAISYTKGCYIGQEIISRIKTTGKMPSRLMTWHSTSALSPGQLLHTQSDQPSVGRITSAHTTPTGSTGLAYVKQAHALADSRLIVATELSTLSGLLTLVDIVQR
jgi:tRNA-modifying protein YgfZ